MSEPILTIAGLTVVLKQTTAAVVEEIDITVRRREIVCVVGESGSGKSVTAFSVMGLLPDALAQKAGSIKLLGEEVIGAGPEQLRSWRGTRMGMIFQEPMTALNPVLRVGDQIAEVFRWHCPGLGRHEIEGRVETLLADMRLPDPGTLARSYPHQLSGGQRQRIMIAMALALEPALLIADEPTTALDVTTQKQILALIKELVARRDIGVLFITHDFGVVAEIADRIVVMRRGTIVEQGQAAEILARPSHPYTRMLIDAVPRRRTAARTPVAEPEILQVRGLGKTYARSGLFRSKRGVGALADASFDLRRGEILGVVGESGSGKSTLARCVARLHVPSSGEIRLGGTDIAQLSERQLRPHRRRIQIVFQDPYRSLNPRIRIGRSLVEGAMNFGLDRPAALAKARGLLAIVGLDDTALERFPHQFSGGQRQRICIARALASEPDILVADEAVSALDVSVQAQVLALLADLRERLGLAIIFITHDLRVAGQLCDRLLVMRAGRIVEEGATGDVFDHPQDAYTRELFAAAPRFEPATAP